MSQGSLKLLALILVGLVASPAFARPLKKSEAIQIIPEGEYLVKGGNRVHRSPSRTVASYHPKKKKKKIAASIKKRGSKKIAKAKAGHSSRRPASRVEKHAKKKAKIHRSSKKKHVEKHLSRSTSRKLDRKNASRPRSRRLESDSPLVSAPRSKVARPDRMIVMDDPAVKHPLPRPHAVGAGLTPGENDLDPDSEGPPAEVGEAKAAAEPPVVVGPAPASVGAESAPPSAAAEAPEAPTSQAAAESASREPDAFDLHSGQDPMHGP